MNQVISVQARSPRLTGRIYYSSGSEGGYYSLWTYDGASCSEVWTGASGEIITLLFYTGGTVYMHTVASDDYGVVAYSLYSFAPGGTPSLVGSGTGENRPVQAALFGGTIYLACVGYYAGSVDTLNLATGARTQVLSSPSDEVSMWSYGTGIGVLGSYLYYGSPNNIYRSTDGTSWANVFWGGDGSGPDAAWIGGFATSESLGALYCYFQPHYVRPNGIYRVSDQVLELETTPNNAWNIVHVANGSTQSLPSAIVGNGSGGFDLYQKSGGSWGYVNTVPLGLVWFASAPKGLTSDGGALYAMFDHHSVGDAVSSLWKYQGGTWTQLWEGAGYTYWTAAMCPCNDSLKPHEV